MHRLGERAVRGRAAAPDRPVLHLGGAEEHCALRVVIEAHDQQMHGLANRAGDRLRDPRQCLIAGDGQQLADRRQLRRRAVFWTKFNKLVERLPQRARGRRKSSVSLSRP